MGLRLLNSLPKAVKECSSPDSFKTILDEYIMSLPNTSPTPSYVVQPIIIVFWTGQKPAARHLLKLCNTLHKPDSNNHAAKPYLKTHVNFAILDPIVTRPLGAK